MTQTDFDAIEEVLITKINLNIDNTNEVHLAEIEKLNTLNRVANEKMVLLKKKLKIITDFRNLVLINCNFLYRLYV